MRLSPFDLLTDLLEDRVSPEKVSLVVKGLFLFVFGLGLLAILSAPVMTSQESIFYEMVKGFSATPNIKADQIDLYKLKVYLYSLPFKAGSFLGAKPQAALMRLFGLAFMLLAMWLAYQTAKRIFPRDDFLPLAVLALLATNNKLTASATTIGGNAFTFFFFAFLVYEFAEIAGKGSIFDVGVALVLVFILSRIDVMVAQNVALPILFFVIIAAFIAAYQNQIVNLMPPSIRARLAIAAAIVFLFILAQRVNLLALALFAPTSVFISVVELTAWPAIIRQMVTFFADSPSLAGGFLWAQQSLFVIFEILALTGLVGIGHLIYVAISQYVQVTPKEAAPATAGASVGDAGWQIFWVKPDRSIFKSFNLPAFLTIALIPLTVFAANNAYNVGGVLSEAGVYLLTIPLTVLVAAGFRQIASTKALAAALWLLPVLLTANIAALLLSILWR